MRARRAQVAEQIDQPVGNCTLRSCLESDTVRWRKWLFRLLTLVLYLTTWVGGWASHARDMAEEAAARYTSVLPDGCGVPWPAPDHGADLPVYRRIHKDGPGSGVIWCVPLLPGLLLADSYYAAGPLYAKGGVKLVFWSGFRTVVLCDLYGWSA